MATMSGTATITIISGPDRGKVFEVRDELVRIGAGAENDLPLSDPELADRNVRIVRRNGRFAISTVVADVVEVDGNLLPAERWVWLPESARVRLGGRTSFQFAIQSSEDAAESTDGEAATASASLGDTDPQSESATPAPRRRAKGSERQRKPGKSAKGGEAGGRQVGRFITSQKGDALVTLGEDGQLPELSLQETSGGRKRTREKKKPGDSSWMVYVAVGVSVSLSLLLLLFPAGPGGTSNRVRNDAREQIKQFHGDHTRGPLKEYEILLRQAALEHSRGNRAGEMAAYEKVRDRVYAGDLPDSGLTGHPERDDELKRLLGILKSR
ncbi:MAG: FHA domain-containing protein [Planctomycetaceae bacterium]